MIFRLPSSLLRMLLVVRPSGRGAGTLFVGIMSVRLIEGVNGSGSGPSAFVLGPGVFRST